MSGIIQTPGLSGGRQGVMKEKIVDVKVVRYSDSYIDDTGYDCAKDFEADVNNLLSQGYQPMPGSFHSEGCTLTIVMIKSKMDVEMI